MESMKLENTFDFLGIRNSFTPLIWESGEIPRLQTLSKVPFLLVCQQICKYTHHMEFYFYFWVVSTEAIRHDLISIRSLGNLLCPLVELKPNGSVSRYEPFAIFITLSGTAIKWFHLRVHCVHVPPSVRRTLTLGAVPVSRIASKWEICP